MSTSPLVMKLVGQVRPARWGWTDGPSVEPFSRWIKGLAGLLLVASLLPLRADQPPPKPLSVATNLGNPPYEYVDAKGQPSGFNNELLEALEGAIGRKIDIRSMPFGDGRDAFERGELDALGTVIYSEARAKVMDFTVPTHSMTYILLVRKGDRSINSELDLTGKTVVINRRNAVAEHFKLRGIPYRELNSNEECIQALADGRADCAVAPKYTWLYLKDLHGYAGISMLSTEIYPSRRGIAVHKGNAQLLAQLNDGLFRLKENGTLDRLYAKHFGALEASEVPLPKILRRALVTIAPAIAILLLAGLGSWSWVLRRMVRKRTTELREELAQRVKVEAERAGALAELTRYKAHLEELVTLRSGELHMANLNLVRAKDSAEAANRMKSTFLANMSHEIRTPMNAVTVFTHLALQTELTDKQRQYLEKTKTAVDSLLGIINDILDFSKIEAGKLQMHSQEFLLEEVFEQVTQLIRVKSAEKHLEFLWNIAADVPPCLFGDPLRLGQVLTNLCGNAVKFTEAGEVIVTVTALPAEKDLVRLQFSVRDTGIGMSAEQIQLLFLPFSQVDASSTRKFIGTGLGLAISKHLVGLMGGELRVESELGQGSEFCFTVTLGRGQMMSTLPDATTQALAGLRILVVDDSPIARLVLHGLATGLGYQATMLASTRNILEELARAPYDLVLMDWRMPEEDGFAGARRIRQTPGWETTPRIIMVTAYGEEEVAQRVAEEGLDGYLTKPVSPSSLFDAITRAFGTKNPSRQIHTAHKVPTQKELARLRGARVLLVEDNDFNQQVAIELLTLMGMVVTLAADGREALDKARPGAFDVVLMDLQMPNMDGYETTRLLRSDPAFAALPILAMTAHAMLPERERCLALGMNDYITKPINPNELFSTLANWIQREAQAVPSPTPPPSMAMAPTKSLVDPPLTLTLPGISWAQGLAVFDGKIPLYLKMLGRFLSLKANAAAEIKTAWAERDLETASRLAHSMIAVAGSIGAMDLSTRARDLQNALHADAPTLIEPLVSAFEQELAAVIQGLRPHFDQP